MRVWFITGVSMGLGRALADAVLASGDTVIGTLRKDVQCREFENKAPGRAIACQVDLSEVDCIPQAFSTALAKTGRVDILVNNAGYGLLGALEESGEQEDRRQMETNFFAPLALIKAALPGMRARRDGRIINVSSVAGFKSNPGLVIYSASKHALNGLSQGLAIELAPIGVRVTVVEPGGFRTEWSGASMARVEASIPDYAASAGKVRAALESYHGHQPGDPVRAAQAIVKLADMTDPPVFLVLGTDAIAQLEAQLNLRSELLDRHRPLSASTDFSAAN